MANKRICKACFLHGGVQNCLKELSVNDPRGRAQITAAQQLGIVDCTPQIPRTFHLGIPTFVIFSFSLFFTLIVSSFLPVRPPFFFTSFASFNTIRLLRCYPEIYFTLISC